MSETFASRIQEVREKAGISKYAFAKKLNMSPSSILNYETGRTVPGDLVIKKVCRIFDVDFEWLKNGISKGEELAEKITKTLSEEISAEDPAVKTKAETFLSEETSTPESDIENAAEQAVKEPAEETAALRTDLSVIIQSQSGAEIDVTELEKRVRAACAKAEKVYVKPEENRAYWVAKEASGAVTLWEE